MQLFLICVFGLTTQSIGIERALPIAIGSHWHTVLTHESLPALKLQICETAYHRKADMAWEDMGTEDVPKDCGAGENDAVHLKVKDLSVEQSSPAIDQNGR